MKQKENMLNTLLLLWCLLGVFVGPGGAAQSSACSVSHQSGSSGAGQRPLDTTTVSLNNVLLHWSLPPTLHLCLFLPPPRSSLPSSDSKDEDWFLSPPPLPSSTLRELFVVAKWLWCKHVAFDNQTDVIVFVCLLLHPVLPRSAWLCIQLFVRPAEQEKTREKWIKASFLSVLWQDLGLFIAVLADREMNIQLNKTSDLDKTPFMVQFYKTHNTRRPLQTKIDFNGMETQFFIFWTVGSDNFQLDWLADHSSFHSAYQRTFLQHSACVFPPNCPPVSQIDCCYCWGCPLMCGLVL